MSIQTRFTIYGILFGLCFPLGATAVDCYLAPKDCSIWERHLGNPLLLIIDTAPLFLGLFSFMGGRYASMKLAVETENQRILEEKENRQREYAEELARQNMELQELNRTLDGLVYTASHDLKTPVINFKSMLMMLRSVKDRPNSGPMVEDIINRMEAAAQRFQDTISDLLDISRIERQDALPSEPIQLKDELTALWAEIKELVDAKGATLDLAGIEAQTISMPRPSFHSVFLNLFSNAIKYAHPDRAPIVRVASTQTGNQVAITVQDNGLGFDVDANQDKLFKMFSRFHAGYEGSGIGLYIIKRTLQKLGGDVTVSSKVGVGTTFHISLDAKNHK